MTKCSIEWPDPRKYTDRMGFVYWRITHNDRMKLHREDGPAYITPTGYESWHYNGYLHREDGPAVTNPIAKKSEWWIKGVLVNWEDVKKRLAQPGYEPSLLEQTMVEYYLSHPAAGG